MSRIGAGPAAPVVPPGAPPGSSAAPARRWSVRETSPETVLGLIREHKVGPTLARVLAGRGLAAGETAAEFLAPGWSQVHDPLLVPGAAEAAREVHGAIARGETLGLYGDYDVDGTTAVVILSLVLRRLGAKVELYIPDRRDEGYGLSEAGLAKLRAKGVTLVLTVDQGVSAHREIEAARGLGMRVVVTDHHALPATLPEAAAIVHPCLPGSRYPNPGLCGAAVAFKLGEALLATAPGGGDRARVEAFRRTCVDLVALATLSDMSPLLGENRALVALGLTQMARSAHPGLAALVAAGGGVPGRAVTTEDVGFGVAPLLNAAGRLSDPRLALDTLLERDPAAARRRVAELEALNRERRTRTEALYDEARRQSDRYADDPVPVLDLDSDAIGLVGLVAGRLCDRLGKPFVVCARRGGELVGSCRSIPGYDIRAGLESAAAHLVRFGGHPQAAGLTVLPSAIPGLRAALGAHARQHLAGVDLAPRLELDGFLELGALTFGLADELALLGPTGTGNPAPVFALPACRVVEAKPMGKAGSHVRIRGEGFPDHLDAVGFHMREAVDRTLAGPGPVDLAFRLGREEWRGRLRLKLRVEDLRVAVPA